MSLGKSALLVASLATVTIAAASTILMGMGEVATAQAENIERKLRGAGIRLTPEDVKAIKTIEAHRGKFMQMYRDLDAYHDAYAAKNSPRAAEILKHKESMRLVARQLPSADATVGGYYMEIRRYLGGPSQKSAEKMNAVDAAMKKYATEVNIKTGVASIPEPKAPVKSRFDDYVVYVMSFSDPTKMEFYVNGTKVTRKGQSIALKGNQVITVRAHGLDARRMQSRNFKITGSAELLEQTDFRLMYQVKSGNFSGRTSWAPKSETYRWSWTKQPNTNATFKEMTSSHDVALQDNVMAFKYNGNFTVTLNASAKIDWEGQSERPGGARTMQDSGTATGTIAFNCGPN